MSEFEGVFLGVDLAFPEGPRDESVVSLVGPDGVVRSADVLTLEQVVAVVEKLRDADIPTFGDSYAFFVHPRHAVELKLLFLLENRTDRVQGLAWSVLDHERRRRAAGRRPDDPSARECLDRALRVEEASRR